MRCPACDHAVHPGGACGVIGLGVLCGCRIGLTVTKEYNALADDLAARTPEPSDIRDRLFAWVVWWRTCLDCGHCHVSAEREDTVTLVDCPKCGKQRAARTAPGDK